MDALLIVFLAGAGVGAAIVGVIAWLLHPKPDAAVLLQVACALDSLQGLHQKIDTLSLPGWTLDTEDPPSYRFRGLLVPERPGQVPIMYFPFVLSSEDPELAPALPTPDSKEGP